MRYRTVLCLVLIVGLAGCTAAPFNGLSEQERPVTVIANNSANITHTFTVWRADGELNSGEVVIKRKARRDTRVSPGQGLSSYRFDNDSGYVTSIVFPSNHSKSHARYVLEPGEANKTTVENFTVGSTIMVVVSVNDRVVELITANCGEATLVGLEVHTYPNPPGGARAGYECR